MSSLQEAVPFVTANLENFEYDAPEIPQAVSEVAKFVRDHPFEFTLIELGAEYAMDPEDVRQALHATGEHLTAIPMQDGPRHVWGYADVAADEWEYLRRRTGQAASSILACFARMNRVREKYGPPKTDAQAEVAAVLLDLFLALPDETREEAHRG